MRERALFRHINWSIVACTLALAILGFVFIYSGSYRLMAGSGTNYVHRQIAWVAIGIVAAALFTVLDYRKLATFAYFIYAFFIILLAVMLLTSDPRRGAQSWFALGTFAIQPSEFAKVA
ncbi:MAG: FtsW/RodA/SpoVE family cell cycle protein, partial [bacterium]